MFNIILEIIAENPPTALFGMSGIFYLVGQSETGGLFLGLGAALQALWLVLKFGF